MHGFLAHLELLDLAGDGHREFVDELHVAGNLEVGDACLAERLSPSSSRVSPSLNLTQAMISSPYFSSGTPMTWTSEMAGCV